MAKRKVTPELLDRLPPSDRNAERGVLGSVVLLPEVLDDLAGIIDATDFYDDAHAVLFGVMMEIHNEGRPVDITLLVARLRQDDQLDFIGGAAALAEILQAVPHAANAVHYANIVADKSRLRLAIVAGTEIIRDGFAADADGATVVDHAERKVFALSERRSTTKLLPLEEICKQALERIANPEAAKRGIPTGFADLDKMIGGMFPGELFILSARPSMGKSALALNIAETLAVDKGRGVLFVSLEMGADQLADRVLSSRAKVDGMKMRNGGLTATDRKALAEHAGDVHSAPMFIVDNPAMTMTEIAAHARRCKRQYDIEFVCVDYLQLIKATNTRDPREQQVAEISRRLKGLARELNVPVMCLAQLNRATETQTSKKPMLSNLRESGAIEQDADVVAFIHRESYYATSEQQRQELEGEAELLIRKTRNGPTGDIKLVWRKQFTRFETALRYEANADLADFNSGTQGF